MTNPPTTHHLIAGRLFDGAVMHEPGHVVIAADRVVYAGGPVPSAGLPATDLGDVLVAPGFVDMHCHGGGGAGFETGAAAAQAAAAAHQARGTTSLVASLVSAPIDELAGQIATLRPLVATGELAGIHLEGPWLSGKFAGAHDPRELRDPRPADVDALLDAADGALVMVTLAPERRGAIDAIRRLVDAGVVVAIGHTDADYATTMAAIDAGARVATHLFNAERPLHHRDPGPIPALLSRPEVTVELIADGVHVHPAVMRMAVTLTPGRLALITDAIAAAAAPPGRYHLGSRSVTSSGEQAVIDGTTTLAGSVLTMDRAVTYAVSTVGMPLTDALAAATSAPARALHRSEIGVLSPGALADLVVLGPDLSVNRVMRRGSWQT